MFKPTAQIYTIFENSYGILRQNFDRKFPSKSRSPHITLRTTGLRLHPSDYGTAPTTQVMVVDREYVARLFLDGVLYGTATARPLPTAPSTLRLRKTLVPRGTNSEKIHERHNDIKFFITWCTMSLLPHDVRWHCTPRGTKICLRLSPAHRHRPYCFATKSPFAV